MWDASFIVGRESRSEHHRKNSTHAHVFLPAIRVKAQFLSVQSTRGHVHVGRDARYVNKFSKKNTVDVG